MHESVLFIHSTGTTPLLWSSVPASAIGNRRAICPANLGYPPNPPITQGQQVSAADEVDHLRKTIPDDPHPIHIVAHSYGATIALELARLPDFRERIASMVLVEPVLFAALIQDADGSIAAANPDVIESARRLLIDSPLADPEKGGTAEWLEAFIDYWNRPGSWARLPDVAKRQTLAVGWKMYQEVRICSKVGRPFREYVLPAATTLVMGQRTTEHSRVMTRALAQAHSLPVVELASAGHMAPMTHPALVFAAIGEHFQSLGK